MEGRIHRLLDGRMEEFMDYWMEGWKNSGNTGWNDGRIQGLLDRRMEEFRDFWMEDGRIHRVMNGRFNGCLDERIGWWMKEIKDGLNVGIVFRNS